MSPQVSVIITTYNRAAMVAEAVESVLAQEMTDFELIVIDDGSTDETEEKLSVYVSRLRYYQQENAGVSAARNRGLEIASAPLVAFLDSDDLWLPAKLQVQHKYMKENPEIQICQTEEIWWRNGRRVNPKRHHRKPSGDIFRRSLDLCLVSPSAVMVRVSLLEKVGYFDEELPAAEDYDLWLRVSAEYPVVLLPSPLVIKRGGHADQLSARSGIDRYRIKALEKLLQSGRLSTGQYKDTWKVLQRKCQIYGEGCWKRGKIEEGERYLCLPEIYRHEVKELESR
ncbi:MAG: glycosyltransferase family 2 protein [Deltaproteobacteria bacterium]|nr:glycosyltransferase family 2 protein [Deltaproteobacteria bacterium]